MLSSAQRVSKQLPEQREGCVTFAALRNALRLRAFGAAQGDTGLSSAKLGDLKPTLKIQALER